MSLQETIGATITRHAMLRFGGRIGVAVSGGADSVFLLHALRDAGLAAVVLHVNHRLRGAESDRDEAFVRTLAAELGLPIEVATSPVPEGNIEQEARRARYAFFEACIASGACDAVATGHTLDDQAETLVSRFLRGAGTAGLSGIRPVTDRGIVRPLLALRRDDIRASLASRNILWREDASNADTVFLRNRIRLDLMPQLVALNPGLPDVLASTAAWAQDEEAYWTSELARLESRLLTHNGEAVLLQVGLLNELPVAVQRRLLRRAVENVRGSLRAIDFRHIEGIRALSATREGSGRLQLPDLDVYRSFDWLRLAPLGLDSRFERDFEIPLEVPGSHSLPERRITIEMELVAAPGVYNNQMNVLDWSRCAGSLTLRNWRPGDSYRPAGRSGSKDSPEKIKSLFQEFRVPLWERRTWPVITQGSSILWTRRFGPAAEVSAGPDSKQFLLIRDGVESNAALRASNQAGPLLNGEAAVCEEVL